MPDHDPDPDPNLDPDPDPESDPNLDPNRSIGLVAGGGASLQSIRDLSTKAKQARYLVITP